MDLLPGESWQFMKERFPRTPGPTTLLLLKGWPKHSHVSQTSSSTHDPRTTVLSLSIEVHSLLMSAKLALSDEESLQTEYLATEIQTEPTY